MANSRTCQPIAGCLVQASKPIWDDLLGQPEAVSQLELAVRHRVQGVHHAWLMTGPPGSGRSNLAHAFAAALLCAEGGCGVCKSCVLAQATAAAGDQCDLAAHIVLPAFLNKVALIIDANKSTLRLDYRK